ncbi:MFS transporter [Mycobacterium kansasii]|uniref:MDR family MFS transporter n=1 Tax=Mycobacterium kansasii TaxID=1768 RepID=UPI000CDDBEB8|nr:MDR family MFS transporter [Mycobacterium kansasii]POX90727.1 MFS transporter [Mycobacterium kansasii]POY05537.1 MFS transporter [Mycobacterium kansasii]POY21394.1 MFS transporter [Mycobacterium kansasii]POY33050.1 MFS transporter [Mycobacterium kansasii]
MTSPTASRTAAADTRSTCISLSPARRNIIFMALMLGVLVAAMDQTIVVPALPTIVDELGVSVHQSWAITSYLLGGTIVVVVAGKLGDLFGRKRVLQGSVLVFLLGSMLCGAAQTMTTLAVSRAVQGVGAGAISVTAAALVGEAFPLRDRGRYQGILGAVFGVTTVAGPLLGGFCTDYLHWRWAFWINLPISIVVLAVTATAIPALPRRPKPAIDYLGIMVIALATTALITATSLGGSTYSWGSAPIMGLFIGATVALGVFVWVEGRAPAGILPPRLFRNQVFAVCSVLSLMVGFAMLGALTFVPMYLRYVDGASATVSGLRTLPMVVGLLTTSVVAGIMVGRTGRYKIFPVAGTGLMAVAFLLMSQMDESTPALVQSLYLVLLGAGIGLSMQVLILIVQNTSRFEDLGVATSGVTFFRVVGASFGAAIFGALFATFLGRRMGPALVAGGAPVDAAHSPAVLHRLPHYVAAPIVRAYAESLNQVFLCAAFVALAGFILALFLREVPLADIHDSPSCLGDGFAVPRTKSPEDVLEIAVTHLLHEAPVRLPNLAAAYQDSELDVAGLWGVLRIYQYERFFDTARLTDIAQHLHLPHQVLEPVFDRLVQTGYASREGDTLSLTPAGLGQIETLSGLLRRWLVDHLAVAPGVEQQPDHQEFEAALQRLTDGVLVQRDWYEDLDELAPAGTLVAAK